MIRPCAEADIPALLDVLNQAGAEGKPAPPALTPDDLRSQMAAGLRLLAWEEDGHLAAVAGLQDVSGVTLMRHGRVAAAWRGKGVAARLLQHLWSLTERPVLTAIWAFDEEAVLFCERHGFRILPQAKRAGLLKAYWSLPEEEALRWVILVDDSWLHPPRRKLLAPAWAASAGVLALLWGSATVAVNTLPQQARLPMHWGLDGKADGYGSPAVALFGVPGLALVLTLALGLLPLADARLSRSRSSLRAYRGLWLSLLGLLAIVQGCLLATAFGLDLPVVGIVMAALGGLLAYSGSALRHLEPNSLIGIRTPATLRDPELWRRVHRAAAPYFYAHGGLLAGAAVAGAPPVWLAGILLGGLVVVTAAMLVLTSQKADAA